MVRLTNRPDMTLDVYCGRKTTTQQQQLCCVGCLRVTNVVFVPFKRSDKTLFEKVNIFSREVL